MLKRTPFSPHSAMVARMSSTLIDTWWSPSPRSSMNLLMGEAGSSDSTSSITPAPHA